LKYHISELIDAEAVQQLIEKFYGMTGVPGTLTDEKGVALKINEDEMVSSGWVKVCVDFYRKNPESFAKCIENNLVNTKEMIANKQYSLYKCGNGMVDGVVPVFVDGEHSGYLFTGPLFLDPPDIEHFKEQGVLYGYEEEKYLKAIREVPVLNREKVEKGLMFLGELARVIALMGLKEKELLSLKNKLGLKFEKQTHDFKKTQTEKMEAVAVASEAKKLALVGQVAGKMAHDFNNILSIIMGNAELALLECGDEEARKTFELIYKQTIHGRNLTKNLVAFAKDQEPKLEYFSINKKVKQVLKLLKKELGSINTVTEHCYQGPEIIADPGMLEHTLVNIIQNSIHAVSLVEQPEIIIKTSNLDNQICIKIGDNGCGIPQEFLEKIFEPSFTLKGSKDRLNSYSPGIKGTGYGLANVKKYIAQHKGKLSIDSEFNNGTEVIIALPIITEKLTDNEIISVEKENFSHGKYILLVEDEEAISNIQHKILTHEFCNHRVDIAKNGQIAMDLFKENQYDFVSLDYVLPGGINGMNVYHYIRKTNKTIPILFISGNIEFIESIKELKEEDPYIDHLSKPCMNVDYLKSINKLLEG
jgi:signal transduction histidine kinase